MKKIVNSKSRYQRDNCTCSLGAFIFHKMPNYRTVLSTQICTERVSACVSEPQTQKKLSGMCNIKPGDIRGKSILRNKNTKDI